MVKETALVMNIAVLFPGQGAQHAGMGRDFYDHFREARLIFDQAEAILGRELIETIFYGPEEKLAQTEHTQPAIFTVSTAIYRVLSSRGLKVSGLAGLSLGEYGALVAAGALEFEKILPLVRKRGIYMQEAVPLGQGRMTAIMGLSNEIVEKICVEASKDGFVAPANYNCNGQVVIAGTLTGLAKAAEMAGKAGAKKITKLKVSAPFHCAMLQPAEEKLALELDKVEIGQPNIPVVFNINGQFAKDPGQVKTNLVRQVSNPILWSQSVNTLVSAGIDTFIGVGPGNSLFRSIKRIAPGLKAYSVETVDDVKMLPKMII